MQGHTESKARLRESVPTHALLSLLTVAIAAFFTFPSPPPVAPALNTHASMIRLDRDPLPDSSRKGNGPNGVVETRQFSHTFYNQHTKEILAVPTATPPERLGTLFADFLRCRVTGSSQPMASVPIQMALAMADKYEVERIVVISGFRSPKFNEQLRKKGRQVARASHHTKAEALDFRLEGVPAKDLAASVAEVHQGGIGTYRKSDFVHVDVGRDRRWNGK